jgi:hypothetical protein
VVVVALFIGHERSSNGTMFTIPASTAHCGAFVHNPCRWLHGRVYRL